MAEPPELRGRGRPGDLLALAVSVALLSALWFVASTTVSVWLLHELVAVSRDYVWMSPLSYLMFFLAVWAPVAVIGLLLGRARAIQVGTLVFVAFAVFGFLLPHTEIARLSAAIIALGAGVVMARVVRRSPERWVIGARRLSLLLAALFVVVGLAAVGWRAVAQRQALAALPPSIPGAPNVLLIILDTVRGDELSSYGYPRPTTPNLDTFATGGTLFETAIATAPWTLPSHASIFTGRYSGRLSSSETTPLDRRERTLAELMARQGYQTAGFVANLYYTTWDTGVGRGFNQYSDYQISLEQVIKSSNFGRAMIVDYLVRTRNRWTLKRAIREPKLEVWPMAGRAEKIAPVITREFLEWSEDRSPDRPYFAFLNYFDAHGPYSPPPEFRRQFVRDPKNPDKRDLYDGDLAYLDRELGRLFQALERRGDFRNTLVIVTSDHGEHFGERGMWEHGNSLYAALIHVPLIMRFDGRIPTGRRVREAVSLRDLGATILDLSGLESRGFPGMSLARRWRDSTAPTSPAIAEGVRFGLRDPTQKLRAFQILALVDDGWHYLREGRHEVEELFRFHEDPDATINLVGSPEGMEVLPRMRRTLVQALVADARDTAFAAAQARKRSAGVGP